MPKIKKVKMKKQEIERDHFAETIMGFYHDVKHNWQKYLIIVSALIIIILGIAYYVNNQKARNIDAGQDFYTGTQLFMTGNYADAIETFDQVQKRYYGTSAARKADYYKGLTYMYSGDNGNAAKFLRKYINSSSDNDILKANAYLVLGKMYQSQMKTDSALIYLSEAESKYPDSYIMPEIYLTMGAVYEMEMDIINADKYYRKIIYKYPNTVFADRAGLYRNMLNGAVEVLTQSRVNQKGSDIELKMD